MSPRQERPEPLEPQEWDDARTVLGITLAWAVGLAVLLALAVADVTEVRGWWLGMCGYGIALGVFGVHHCRRRQAAIARERAGALPPSEPAAAGDQPVHGDQR